MSPQPSPHPARHRRARKRGHALVAGDREAIALAAHLGGEIRRARRRRHLTQAALAARVGIRQPRITELERGEGVDAPLRLWARIGIALGSPLAVTHSHPVGEHRPDAIDDAWSGKAAAESIGRPRDAGHLAAEELVLQLARATGRTGLFELPTRPANPARSVDIGIRDDRRRLLILVETWNRLDDIGAAARATSLKEAQARELAVAIGGDDGPYDVATAWLLVPTAANRALVRRYPEVFRSRFPGPSVRWVDAIQAAAEPPSEPGIAWVDVARGRIVPIRLPG